MQSSITGGELKMYQEFADKVKDIINDNIRCVHTAMPGKILTFDPDRSEEHTSELQSH